MAGVDEDHFPPAFEHVENGLPVHARTLDGHMGTARVDQPIRQAQYIIRHSRACAPFLLVLFHEARHHRLGVHVEATATLLHDLPGVLLAATACARGCSQEAARRAHPDGGHKGRCLNTFSGHAHARARGHQGSSTFNADGSRRVLLSPAPDQFSWRRAKPRFMTPRPYDLHSAQIRKSDDLDNTCAKMNAFWHKRLQCKSYQRWVSGAADGGSEARADAVCRRLQTLDTY